MTGSSFFDRDSRVSRGIGFVDGVVDGEVVALNIDKGSCYGLNKVGSRVWALVGDGARVGDICDQLVREYRIEPADCERQVLDLLEELRMEGLIQVSERTAALTP